MQREKPSLNKQFLKRLLYIVLCAIPICIFKDDKGTYRLVPLPFFLIGMYNLLWIISRAPQIIDSFSPPKTAYEKIAKPFDLFAYYACIALFFIGMFTLLLQIQDYDNTIHGMNLFWLSGCAGLLIAMAIVIVLKKAQPSVFYESNRRFNIYAGLFIGLFLLAAAIAGYINHTYTEKQKNCSHYTLVRKSTSSRKHREHFLFLKINDVEERFSVKPSFYEQCNEGEQIELCSYKGMFGFDYVDEFNTFREKW